MSPGRQLSNVFLSETVKDSATGASEEHDNLAIQVDGWVALNYFLVHWRKNAPKFCRRFHKSRHSYLQTV